MDAGLIQFQQLNLLAVFTGAEDDAQRWRFVRLLLMLGQPAQVKLHLALVGCFEFAEFQFDGHQSFQATVVEQQVDVEIVVVDLQTFLASDKSEPCPQLKKEAFQFPQNGVFQILFQIAILQAKEVEDVGIF